MNNLEIYLGIYIECKKIYENQEKIVIGCSKCLSKTFNNKKFCPDCGEKIKKYSKVVKEYNNYQNKIIEDLDDDLLVIDYFKDRIIYILNGNEKYSYSSFLKDENVLEIKNINQESFIKDNSGIIDFFERYFKNNYTIKYGIITYYN